MLHRTILFAMLQCNKASFIGILIIGATIMYQEIIDNYTAQADKLIAPVEQFVKLSLNNTEKLYAMQLEIAQSYVNLGLEQLIAFTEVKDAESLQVFVGKQVDVAKNMGEKLISDSQAVADLGNEFNSETQRLAIESLNAVVAQAA